MRPNMLESNELPDATGPNLRGRRIDAAPDEPLCTR